MATSSEPQPKVDVDQTFRLRIEDFRQYAEKSSRAIMFGEPDVWFHPDGVVNQHDLEGNGQRFLRKSVGEKFVKTVEDPQAPGTVADLSLVQLQGDFLACAERAYRARHHSACRNRAHAAGRLRGHGHPYGVWNQGLLRYVQAIDYSNRSEVPS